MAGERPDRVPASSFGRKSVFGEILETAAIQAVESGLPEDEAVEAAINAFFKVKSQIRNLIVRDLHMSKAAMLEEQEGWRRELESEVERDYGTAFANYAAALRVSYEIGSGLHEEYVRTGAADEYSPACQVLFLLHGRACTVAGEVLHLLRGGYADGANARHRTLHELATVIDILSGEGREELAARYIAYAAVERYKDMVEYQQNCERLGYTPYGADALLEAKQEYEAALEKYGPKFRKRNQWAAPLFPPGVDISIASLEQLVGLSHKRPFYSNANHQVHAGPRAALMNLHRRGMVSYIGVGARSGESVGEIAHGTLIHLLHCTACLVTRVHEATDTNLDDVMGIEVLRELVADAGKSFHRASARMTGT